MNKFLHEPTVRLRAAAANGRGLGVVDTARYLFGLEAVARATPTSHVAHVTSRQGMSRRALVTGGAGFIGSHVAERFLADGWTVDIIDNLSSGKRENVPAAARLHELDIGRPEAPSAGRQRAVRCDRAPRRADRRAPERRRSRVRRGRERSRHAQSRSRRSRRVARSATRFVFASTGGAIYGDLATPPNERDDAEGSRLAVRHREADRGALSRPTTDACIGLESGGVRFANVYGPRQDPHGEAGVVAIFCGRLLDGRPLTVFGDGRQTRDYVYVGDVADAVFRAATDGAARRPVRSTRASFNIGTGIATSVLDLAATLARRRARRAPIDSRRRARASRCSRS